MKVLLVDDEPLITRATSRAIRSCQPDWTVDSADSGREALERISQNEFDCIVTDIQMPVMNGVDLLEQVRERRPQMTRIILSGQADSDVALRAVRPMHRYLAKPCCIDELIFAIESTSLSRKLCNDEELKIAVGGLGALPTLPKLFQDLTAAINDPYGDTESVSNVIKQDPTVTAKILQVVNSALFAFSRKINSIEQATSILGFSMIRSLVLTAQIINDELPQIDGLSVESLFTHSFRSGLTARLICQHERLSSKEMDTAFTATLLHDIGKVVLLDRLTERYAGALKFARDNDCTDLEAELAVIGCTHAAIGGLLLEVWGLPQETVDAVALHHDPKMLNPRNLNYLGNIVYAANLISYGRDLNTCLKALAKAHGAAHAKTLVQKFKTWQMVCANAEQG